MDVFLTIAGFIIGVSVFLYAISFIDGGRKRAVQAAGTRRTGGMTPGMSVSGDTSKKNRLVEGGRIQYSTSDVVDGMPLRTCPLCSKTLSRNEPLYATHTEVGNQKKVLIHGCPYCYKG